MRKSYAVISQGMREGFEDSLQQSLNMFAEGGYEMVSTNVVSDRLVVLMEKTLD
jgi:hypothetical protein